MPQVPKYGPASNMLQKTGKRLTRYKESYDIRVNGRVGFKFEMSQDDERFSFLDADGGGVSKT